MTRVAMMLAGLALVSAGIAGAAGMSDFYVSPQGNDGWSGALAAPNGAGDDGPFATLAKARDAIRELKAREPNRAREFVVMVRGGQYQLDEALQFTPEDSGTEQAPVVFMAYPGEEAVITGGRPITGWQVTDNGRWQVTLPEVAAGEWDFTQLWVDGQRRFRPRLPEKGYYYIARELNPTAAAGGRGYDTFGFLGEDISPDWSNLGDVEVLPFHQWSMARLRIASVDAEARSVVFTGPTCNSAYWAKLARGHRYLVDNVKEALDAPGEWYLDRPTGVLTYIPMEGEEPGDVEVIAPRAQRLVEIRGDAELGLPVTNLHLRGLTFAHTNWVTPPQGQTFPQADASLGTAITLTGAVDCVIEDCTIAHLGEYAVAFANGTSNCRIEGCVITDMAAGGVKLGGQGYHADESKAANNITVRDNIIAQGGRMHPAAVGVWIGHSGYNTIEHNDIHDFYYTGISVGWQWGYNPSNAHHNTIARNHVYQIGQGVLSDMGGIYTLGPSEGTIIERNLFHDIESYSYGGWGIYFDQATTAILATKNIVHDTKTGGFHQHFGKDNRVENNIFAFAKTGQLQRTRAEEHTSFMFERNIVYWDEGPLLSGRWDDDGFVMGRNIYWDARQEPVQFAGNSFDEWQAKGRDADSIVADPMFLNPAERDFTILDPANARKVGFEPFDLADTGRLTPGGHPEPAPRAFPGWEPMPPLPLTEDFEGVAVGQQTPAARTYEANDTETVRVTDEIAAGGSRSLKFSDGPQEKTPWDPHVFFQPSFGEGILRGRFSLFMREGSVLMHEWRDQHPPRYRVGPTIWIMGDGTLKSQNQELARLPHDQWLDFEITAGVGEDADGTFDLRISTRDEALQLEFEDLPCSEEWGPMRWFGFCAHATRQAEFFLDDIVLEKME